MIKTFRAKTNLMTAMATILAATACASGSGGADTLTSGFTALSENPAPPSNENINVISAGNPLNGGAVDQTFEVAAAFQTTRINAVGGEEVIARSRTDFRNPAGTVFFNASNNTLTFDLSQGVVDIQETFGPILLSEVGEFTSLENDRLAVTISSIPEQFPAIPAGLVLPGGALTLEDLRGDPQAVDSLITDLQGIASSGVSAFGSTISSEEASSFLATLDSLTDAAFSTDYVLHQGTEGSSFLAQEIVNNGSGVNTNYVTLGLWETTPVGGLAGDVTRGASVFGVLTPPNEVPITGSATYTTVIGGTVLRNGTSEFLTGSVFITANFGTRIVDLGIGTRLQDFDAMGNVIFSDFVDLEGEGLLTGGNRFDGDLRGSTDPSIRGEVAGAFFGPEAVEVGGTFRFGNDSFEAAGGFTGVQDDANTMATP